MSNDPPVSALVPLLCSSCYGGEHDSCARRARGACSCPCVPPPAAPTLPPLCERMQCLHQRESSPDTYYTLEHCGHVALYEAEKAENKHLRSMLDALACAADNLNFAVEPPQATDECIQEDRNAVDWALVIYDHVFPGRIIL